MAAGAESIYTRPASRSAKLAFGFVACTTAFYAATWLFNLLLVFPDSTPQADRHLYPLILYPSAAVLSSAAAVAVLRSSSVVVPGERRALLAGIAGVAVGAAAIGLLWLVGGAAPAYIALSAPLAVALAAGRTGGRAAAVVLSWTATLLCASAWLAHVMQHV